jgi:hypothetical protein
MMLSWEVRCRIPFSLDGEREYLHEMSPATVRACGWLSAGNDISAISARIRKGRIRAG